MQPYNFMVVPNIICSYTMVHYVSSPIASLMQELMKMALGENMIKYTTKVVMNSYNHIFTHKCKKVELKPFQSLSNHHGAQY